MDKALKQRLVGASVLIILAVIVLPMLLSGRSDTRNQESRQIELPPKPEEMTFETRRFPVGDVEKTPPVVVARSPGPDLAAEETSDSQVANVEPETVLPGETDTIGDSEQNRAPELQASDDEPATITPLEISASDEVEQSVTAEPQSTPRYLVQVASFSTEKRANALADLLRAGDLQVVMDVVDRSGGLLYRVRVGPFAERSDADEAVTSVGLLAADLSPRVLDMNPDNGLGDNQADSPELIEAGDPLLRWVVQVGSFNNPANAERLVAELRLAGLAAFSEAVTTAEKTAFKVLIGPEINRQDARELARKVKAEHQLDGMVLSLD